MLDKNLRHERDNIVSVYEDYVETHEESLERCRDNFQLLSFT